MELVPFSFRPKRGPRGPCGACSIPIPHQKGPNGLIWSLIHSDPTPKEPYGAPGPLGPRRVRMYLLRIRICLLRVGIFLLRVRIYLLRVQILIGLRAGDNPNGKKMKNDTCLSGIWILWIHLDFKRIASRGTTLPEKKISKTTPVFQGS